MSEHDEGHLDAEEVAAYLGGDIPPRQRARLERHLAHCAQCCDELVAVGALVPTPSRRKALVLGGGLAAAVLAAILLIGSGAFGENEAPVLRAGDEAEEVLQPAVESVYPSDGDLISTRELRFVWRPVAPDALYELTLWEAGGVRIWQKSTRDTVLTPGQEVVLRAGDRYYWLVDALLTNGEAADDTGLQWFTVR